MPNRSLLIEQFAAPGISATVSRKSLPPLPEHGLTNVGYQARRRVARSPTPLPTIHERTGLRTDRQAAIGRGAKLGYNHPLMQDLNPAGRTVSMSSVNRRHVTVRRSLAEADDGGFMPGTPEERVLEVWELTREVWAFSQETNAESRLQRDVAVLVRGES